jgi:hypothetical protein
MHPAHHRADFFSAGMVFRSDKGADDGQALRSDRQPPLAAALNEFAQPPR